MQKIMEDYCSPLNYPLLQKSGLLIFFVKGLIVFKLNVFEEISFHILTPTNSMQRLMAENDFLLGRNKFWSFDDVLL